MQNHSLAFRDSSLDATTSCPSGATIRDQAGAALGVEEDLGDCRAWWNLPIAGESVHV
jgi:hypothetical protein